MLATHLYKTLLVIVLLGIMFELGQALYFLMTSHPGSGSHRTAWALTRRVGLSVLLIILIVIGIRTGLLHPHGIYVR